jgi:hypothetical protein
MQDSGCKFERSNLCLSSPTSQVDNSTRNRVSTRVNAIEIRALIDLPNIRSECHGFIPLTCQCQRYYVLLLLAAVVAVEAASPGTAGVA